jgi:hypothetical protein
MLDDAHPNARRAPIGSTALLLVVGAASSFACEQLLGVDFDSAESRAAAKPCDNLHPPEPPSITGAGGEVEITVVISQARYGDELDAEGRPEHLSAGYDIDGVCTSLGHSPLCRTPAWTGGNPKDGPRGQDNAIGRILAAQERNFGTKVISTTTLNDNLRQGLHAPAGVLRIRGYGGFSEDDSVEVDWFVALAPKRLAGGGFVPKLDGSDVWPLLDNFVEGVADDGGADAGAAEAGPPGDADARQGLKSVFRDTHAYVTASKLVAHFPTISIPLTNVYFDVFEVVVTADLIRNSVDLPWRVTNGVFAARVRAGTLLALTPRITSEIIGQPLCTGDPNYRTVKTFMCEELDLVLTPGSDSRECDAASVGLVFETAGVELGALQHVELGSLCPPETDPESDDCVSPPPLPADGG